MSRQKRIVDTMFRVATVHEREAQLAFGRAQSAEERAQAEAADLDQAEAQAEAELASPGTLGTLERELLWAHRTWVRNERVITEERLAMTAAQVAAAQDRLHQRKRDTRVREKVRDHVAATERSERDLKAQKEQDDLTSTRWNREH